jgi:hypothetical protein
MRTSPTLEAAATDASVERALVLTEADASNGGPVRLRLGCVRVA